MKSLIFLLVLLTLTGLASSFTTYSLHHQQCISFHLKPMHGYFLRMNASQPITLYTNSYNILRFEKNHVSDYITNSNSLMVCNNNDQHTEIVQVLIDDGIAPFYLASFVVASVLTVSFIIATIALLIFITVVYCRRKNPISVKYHQMSNHV